MEVKVGDRYFSQFLTEDEIAQKVSLLGAEISRDYAGKDLIVVGILNGSFMFLADLCRAIKGVNQELSFLKISSYSGTQSTEKVQKLVGLNTEIKGKHVLIVEDIVDTGLSMNFLLEEFENKQAESISIATLLFKKQAFRFNYPLHYVGFEIPNKFVVGYGLDYDGKGRELPEIYQVVSP